MQANINYLTQTIKNKSLSLKGNFLQIANHLDQAVNKLFSTDSQGDYTHGIITKDFVIDPTSLQALAQWSLIPDTISIHTATSDENYQTITGDKFTEVTEDAIQSTRMISEAIKTLASYSPNIEWNPATAITNIETAWSSQNIYSELSESTGSVKQLIVDQIRNSNSPWSACSSIIMQYMPENVETATVDEILHTTGAEYTGVTPFGILTDVLVWPQIDWTNVWNGIKSCMNALGSFIVQKVCYPVLQGLQAYSWKAGSWLYHQFVNPLDLIYDEEGEAPTILQSCIKLYAPETYVPWNERMHYIVNQVRNKVANTLGRESAGAIQITSPFGFFIVNSYDYNIYFYPYLYPKVLNDLALQEYRTSDDIGTAEGQRNWIANTITELSNNGQYGTKAVADFIAWEDYNSSIKNFGNERDAYTSCRYAAANALGYLYACMYGGRAGEGLGSDFRRMYDFILSKMHDYNHSDASSPNNGDWNQLVTTAIDFSQYNNNYSIDIANVLLNTILYYVTNYSDVVTNLPKPCVAIKDDVAIKKDFVKTVVTVGVAIGVTVASVYALKFLKYARSKAIEATAIYNEALYSAHPDATQIKKKWRTAKLWNNLSLGSAAKITGADFTSSSLTLVPIYKAITGKSL